MAVHFRITTQLSISKSIVLPSQSALHTFVQNVGSQFGIQSLWLKVVLNHKLLFRTFLSNLSADPLSPLSINTKIIIHAEPEWPSGLQHRACGKDGRGFKLRISTNASGHIYKYVDQKGLAAMLTSIQSAGATPEVNLRITQVRKQVRRL